MSNLAMHLGVRILALTFSQTNRDVKVKRMQISGTEAISTQIAPS